MIYLQHPVHGAKVATLELEAEADEANGWVRHAPGEQPPEPPNTMQRRKRPARTQVSDDDSGRTD
jgi:hypothetical protein